MTSPVDVKIKNRTTQKITTHVIRDYWVEGDGKSINEESINSEEDGEFHVVAKKSHHGELDINLVGNSSQILGQFKIKSIKDPQDPGALVCVPFQDFVKMSAKGEGKRNVKDQDKDLRKIELEVANQISVSSGWDIVNAIKKNEVNNWIKSLYDNRALQHQFESVDIGCPEIVGGKEDNQGEVTLKIPLDGKMKVLQVSGMCEFTVNLKNINSSIESNEEFSYTLLINLKGDILNNVDLSGLKISGKTPTEKVEEIVLQFINNYFKSLEPIKIPFSTPLPLLLTNTSICLAFVENSLHPDRSFLAILVGLNGNKGTYQLSKDVIYNSPNSTTAFVFSNILFMTACKEMLGFVFGKDLGFTISDANPFIITNTNSVVAFTDGRFFDVNAGKIDVLFRLNPDNNLSLEVKAGKIHVKVDIKLSTENGQLILNFTVIGKVPWWLWINPVLVMILKYIINRDGVIKLTIPNFYCDQISIPSYFRLSGKWVK